MKISLIVAMDCANAIGLNNQMLWHLPADFAWFKKHTLGKPIIMGRKTYESIGRALPGRKNIVLSQKGVNLTDAEVVNSLDDALAVAKNEIERMKKEVHPIETHNSIDEIMIIGGATIYEMSLSLADRLYITEVKHQFKADAFFPDFDQAMGCDTSFQFKLIYEQLFSSDDKNAYDMVFKIYEKENT